jgi:hypothetical protein
LSAAPGFIPPPEVNAPVTNCFGDRIANQLTEVFMRVFRLGVRLRVARAHQSTPEADPTRYCYVRAG